MHGKPSETEEHFFREQELKARLQKLKQEEQALAVVEKERLKDLHWLHCPKCGQKRTTEMFGRVEIDVCANGRGTWLDASELDAIMAEHHEREPLHRFLKVLGA